MIWAWNALNGWNARWTMPGMDMGMGMPGMGGMPGMNDPSMMADGYARNGSNARIVQCPEWVHARIVMAIVMAIARNEHGECRDASAGRTVAR